MQALHTTLALSLLALGPLSAQEIPPGAPEPGEATTNPAPSGDDPAAAIQAEELTFDDIVDDFEQLALDAAAELEALRAELADEKLPLSIRLNELNAELAQVKIEHAEALRNVDSINLEISRLTTRIKGRKDENSYLGDLLGNFISEFDSSKHIVEDQRYFELLERARLAPDNSNLSQQEVFEIQAEVVTTALDRIEDLLNGTRFEGTALDEQGIVKPGTFLLLGPAALFSHSGGTGTAEERLNSTEASLVRFVEPEDVAAAEALIRTGEGFFPLDPTLGNAHKIAATEETFLEHVQKGGPVMIPIFGLAGTALLVALCKWLVLSLQRVPSRKRLDGLLDAVARGDEAGAREAVARVRGPVGRMLQAGVEHLRQPRELIEEVMYERVLTTKLKLQSFLPFIAICAASAPLLGLLGTVTGIISTFKLITVFGSGDVKSLSSGISEALITTKFGLIVAIPSLLLHAFLSRKARGILDRMEKAGLAFLNQVSKAPLAPVPQAATDDIVIPPPAEPEPREPAPKQMVSVE